MIKFNQPTLLSLFFVLFSATVMAQTFSLSADVRDRFEYRHGFNNLFADNADPAAFVQQRTRLNMDYSSDNLKLFIAVQDVSVWGDTRQILPTDHNNSFSLFAAYAQLKLDESWSAKLGRQSISYDNQRIFGGLDWAMQGRFHDAAIFKYKKAGLQFDLGLAYSQENPRNEGNGYNVAGFFSYKTMQYAYLKNKTGNFSSSFLLLNNGFQSFTDATADGMYYRQTAGTYLEFPLGSQIKVNGSAYYQFGKANATTDLGAYQLAMEATLKPAKTLYGVGLELLSGTDQAGSSKNNSFFPLYGTNHKFNGFMDYFYVGNHANSVGLNDVYAKMVIPTPNKGSLLVKAHYFSSNAELANNADPYLGTELDLVYNKSLGANVKMSVGYSKMFASESMSLIKGGRPHDNSNNWAWVQMIFNPKLFQSKLK